MRDEDYLLICKVIKTYVDNLLKKVCSTLEKNTKYYSGFNNSLANEETLKRVGILTDILRRMNIDTDVTKRTAFDTHLEQMHEYHDKIKEVKNKITEIFCPTQGLRGQEFRENMRKASKLADLMEGLLTSAYYDGLNTRLILDTTELGKEEKEYFEKVGDRVDRELRASYTEGSNMLMMAMMGALAGNKFCEDVLRKG